MTRSEVIGRLEQLLALLRQEREAAKALDMDALEETVQAKQGLLAGMQLQTEDVAGLEELLRQIEHENRRNAFLLWTGLNWVREMMGFFGKAAMPQVYGYGGTSQTLNQGGRLLSGKV